MENQNNIQEEAYTKRNIPKAIIIKGYINLIIKTTLLKMQEKRFNYFVRINKKIFASFFSASISINIIF